MNDKKELGKKELRKKLKEARIELPTQMRQQKAKELDKTLAAEKAFLLCKTLAAYWPTGGEMDPSPLIKRAFKMGKRCYLPFLHPLENRLWFIEHQPNEILVANRFGIKEPVFHAEKLIPAWALDLVLIPLVGFDEKGNRLGMGFGYYDHTFSFIKDNSRPKKPQLIGLAYEFQKVEILPKDDWDIPMTGIATEKRFILIGS